MNNVESQGIEGMAYGCDPLMRFVARLTRRSLWKATLLAAAYQLTFSIIPSVLISLYYNGTPRFVGVFDKRECTMVIIFAFILPVAIFAFIVWQTTGIETLFTKLRGTGVIPSLNTDVLLRDFLRDHISRPLTRPWMLVIAILYATATFLLGSVLNWFGSRPIPFWWSINALYYWGIASNMLVVGGYVLCWGIIRQVVVIRALYILFTSREIRPKLMHPDGCMGLSAVGNYTLLFCAPFILWGSGYTMSMVVMPFAYGKDPTLLSTAICIGVYVIILPLFLLLPTLAAHRAMKKSRGEALEKIAAHIRDCLHVADNQAAPGNMESLSRLEHLYKLSDQNYTTWPFRASVIGRFCLVALLPLLPTLIQVIVEIAKGTVIK